MALTPMTLTARLIKRNMRRESCFYRTVRGEKAGGDADSVRSDVDFVLTFEEMAGIFDARHVDIENIERMKAESMLHRRMDETLRLPAVSRNPWWM